MATNATTTVPPNSLAMQDTTPLAARSQDSEFGPRPQWLEELCSKAVQGIDGIALPAAEHLIEAYEDLMARIPGEGEDAFDLDFSEFSDPSHPGSELLRILATECAPGTAGYYVSSERPPLPELPQEVLEAEVRDLLATPLDEMFDRVRRQGPGLGDWVPVGVADLQNSTFLGYNDGNEYRLGVPTRHVKVELVEGPVVHVWIDELGQTRRYEVLFPVFGALLWTATNYLEFDPEGAVELPGDLRTGTPESGQLGEYYGYLDHSDLGEFEFDYSDRGNGIYSGSKYDFHLGGVTILFMPESDGPVGEYEVVGPFGDPGFKIGGSPYGGEPCEIYSWDEASIEMNAVGHLTVREYEVRDHGSHLDELFRASLEFAFTCNVG